MRTALAMLCLWGIVLIGSTSTVSATTGPTRLLPRPKFYVDVRLAQVYRGQYVLKSVAKGARLRDAALGIEINQYKWMYGIAQFYGYDNRGFQTSWTTTLYNFHAISQNRMEVDMIGPTGRPLLGRLYLTRQKNGDLVGQIQFGPRKYSVSFHRINTR